MYEVKKLFWLLLGLCAFLLRLSLRWAWKLVKWCYRYVRKRRERPTHGDAHWASDKELKKAGRFRNLGFMVGLTKSGKRVFTDLEASLIVIGQKRTGKTSTIIAAIKALKDRAPQSVRVQTPKGDVSLMKVKHPDIILPDPKLSAYNATKDDLEELGYKVMILDFVEPVLQHDPFSIFNPNDEIDLVRQIKLMGPSLAPNAKQGAHEHFDNYPRNMLLGIIKYFFKRKPNETTLTNCVLHLIDKRLRSKLFPEMAKEHGDILITGAVDAYESAGDREKGSFITTNFDKLNYWVQPTVKKVTELPRKPDGSINHGWSWDDMFKAQQPIAVFIRPGLGTDEGPLVRLFLANAVNSARRMFNVTGRPLPKGLWVIVDEAMTLGHCDALVQVNRELGEAGVNLMMCWLSYDDLCKTYPEHESLMAGCDWLVFGGAMETKWAEKVSRELGKTTAMSKSESESNYSKGKGVHEQQVNLMNADEVAGRRFEECIALLRSDEGVMKVLGSKGFRRREGKPIKYL